MSSSGKMASVVQLDAPSDWRPGGRGFNPHRGRQHSFVEIDHEIFSTVILSLPLIQEGQLSVSGERMCTILKQVILSVFSNNRPFTIWIFTALQRSSRHSQNLFDTRSAEQRPGGVSLRVIRVLCNPRMPPRM